MDNLTHSLVGAVLGQMGLKTKTGLAMPTLILAANLPDIDAACVIYGRAALSMRRGLTHGPIALLVLPVLLCALMLGFDRWQARRGTRPPGRLPIDKGWLLVLAYIGCLSHPALDWLNNYGVRLLAPFRHRWYYGDTLFIIDVWIWLALGLTVWLSLRREKRAISDWTRPAWVGFTAVCAYIAANGLFTGVAEARIADMMADNGRGKLLVVASPPPIAFWRRDVFWRRGIVYGATNISLFGANDLEFKVHATGMDDPRIAQLVAKSATARAFLFWARMPIATFDSRGVMTLADQRYDNPLSRNQFTVSVAPEETFAGPLAPSQR